MPGPVWDALEREVGREAEKELIVKALAKVPFREPCETAGISRKTGYKWLACRYKWLARFRERGFEGLVDESTRPRRLCRHESTS